MDLIESGGPAIKNFPFNSGRCLFIIYDSVYNSAMGKET